MTIYFNNVLIINWKYYLNIFLYYKYIKFVYVIWHFTNKKAFCYYNMYIQNRQGANYFMDSRVNKNTSIRCMCKYSK